MMVGAATDSDSASVFVFERDAAGQWNQTQSFSLENEDSGLGSAIAIDGDTAVIGGDRSTHGYVFTRRDERQWLEAQVLEFDIFERKEFDYQGSGNFIDLDGDTLVVGTRDASRLGYVTGDVQVLHKSGERWHEYRVLGSIDGQWNQAFGQAVVIDGVTVVTGPLLGGPMIFIRSERPPMFMYWTEARQPCQAATAGSYSNAGNSSRSPVSASTSLSFACHRQAPWRPTASTWNTDLAMSTPTRLIWVTDFSSSG